MEDEENLENKNDIKINEAEEKKLQPKEEKNKNKIKIKKYDFKNEGILLIFNKIITEYSFNIKNRKINQKEEEKPKENEKKEEEQKEGEPKPEEKKEEENKPEEKKEEDEENTARLELLKKELENTTFNELLNKKEKNIIASIIKDYYLYFVTRNEVLERETNDLGSLCNLLEMFCEFQFEFSTRENKELTVDDLLSVIKWTNDFYFEVNELLYCVEYFKLEKIFKKNIFNEILNRRLNKIDIDNDDKKNIIGLKKAMEIIIGVLNDRCIEDPESIAKIIEIIPTIYQIEQKNNLNSKEIYFLFEINYVYLLIMNDDNNNNEKKMNLIRQILKNKLLPIRNLYKENSEREEAYNSLIVALNQNIKKEDKDKNEKYRYIIKILVQEYKKCYKDTKILNVLMKIMENKYLLKVSQLLFHELFSQYFDGTELIFDKITNYNTDDCFLKLISANSNSIYLEQILIEVFESKFNAHFMSYTNEINNTIKYEDLTDEQAQQLLKGKNLENFKKCIELLEDKNIRESNERFLPNIIYCTYIKSYLYQFISYVFKKSNQLIDISDIVNALKEGNNEEFKSNERKVMEIYSFRILFEYLNKNFNDFKNYNFDEKGLKYKNSFKGKDTFDDQIPKIIEFCGRTIEDFINSKGDTPKENEDEQNFYINSFLSIKIVSSAINDNGISINSNEYKEIWDYFSKYLLEKEIHLNYNNYDMYLNYYLVDILIRELKNKLSNNEFGLGSFQNDQDLSHLNNKTLGMIIYILRFCLHSYTVKGGYEKDGKKEKYFYSKLIDYDSSEDINNFINSCFIPGRIKQEAGIQRLDLNTFLLNDNDNANNISNEEPKIEILSILMMRFIFYSHLFFRSLLGKLDNNTFSNTYSVTDGYTCLRMLISLWEKLNSNDYIPGNESNKVEIFFNRVNKGIVSEYKLCKDFTNKENVKAFEESFNKYIMKCRNEYAYFKLIYVDKTMKAIIQQNNFPLSYEKGDYPFMKYFVLTNNPNIEDLKLKIKGNVDNKKLYLTDSIVSYDENLKNDKFENFIKNNDYNRKYLILSNLYSLSPKIYKNSDIKINQQNNGVINKYRECFTDFENKKIDELNTTINNYTNNLIETSMKFLGKFISKLKSKNKYLYKNIRRPMLSQLSINNESIIFNLSKNSKYKSFPHLLSKYIYKDIFMEEKDKPSEYIDLDIRIDYDKYKEFDIDFEGFDDELMSIILPNKRLFYDHDYNRKIIYSFDTFRGNNYNLLNNFIIKYQDCLEEINEEQKQQIKKVITELDKDIIKNDLEKNYISLNDVSTDKNLESKKYEELDSLHKLIVDQYNKSKNEIFKKLEEKINEETSKKIRFDFVVNIYFNLLKIITYLIDNIISPEISLNEIITNLPDVFNISFDTTYFFKNNKDYKLKHIFSIFEEFEKYLFPYILLHVYQKYKTEIFDENKDNIINYFEINKDNLKETKFTKRQLIDAIRKFISRYLTSSDINNEYNNENSDRNDIPSNIPLINYLNKNDLWSLDTFYSEDKIENGFNNIKEFNFLVKHSYDLYKCLSGISFDDNGKIEKEDQKNLKINESEIEFDFYKDISYFNSKNIINNDIAIDSLCDKKEYFNEFYLYYNFGNIYIDYIDEENPDISFLALANSSNGLYCSKWKLILQDILKKDKEFFKKENSVMFNNDKIADIQNLTCIKSLEKSSIYCFGTNNSKLKIIKLKDNYSNIELVHEIPLKDDSVCVNSIIEYNQNKTLIISDEKHIIAFEKTDEGGYNTYTEKKDINTGNKTYIMKIDEHTLAAFICPDIIKFYNIDNYEFTETVINEIKSEVNSNNQKQFKMMNLIGENNNILAVCSNEHSIYIIDTVEKKLIKNCVFEGYENNFVSVVKYNNDHVLLLDSTNNLILTKIEKNEDKVSDLKFVGLLKKLNQDLNLLFTFPYGINHLYFADDNINFKINDLN